MKKNLVKMLRGTKEAVEVPKNCTILITRASKGKKIEKIKQESKKIKYIIP